VYKTRHILLISIVLFNTHRRGKIKFKLYDFQYDVLKEYQENDYNIILKSRQLGISTLSAAYAYG